MNCSEIMQQIAAAQYSHGCPPATMQGIIPKTGKIAEILNTALKKGHADWGGNLEVSRRGKVTDSSGNKVESFCIRFGKYVIDGNLYNAWAVDTLDGDIHILTVRSDITTSMNRLFPSLGDERDWKIMT